MALIHCPECNKEISDKAKVCPKCGYPISKDYKKSRINNSIINEDLGVNMDILFGSISCPKCGSANTDYKSKFKSYLNKHFIKSISRDTIFICMDCKHVFSVKDVHASHRNVDIKSGN